MTDQNKPLRIFEQTRSFFEAMKDEKPGDATGDFVFMVPIFILVDLVCLPWAIYRWVRG